MADLHREGRAREPLSGPPDTRHGDSRLPPTVRHSGATEHRCRPANRQAPRSLSGGIALTQSSMFTSAVRAMGPSPEWAETRRQAGLGRAGLSGPRGRARPRPSGRGAPTEPCTRGLRRRRVLPCNSGVESVQAPRFPAWHGPPDGTVVPWTNTSSLARCVHWLPSCHASIASRRVIGSFSCFMHGPAPRHRRATVCTWHSFAAPSAHCVL
jgi:hypothetical protein